MTVTIVLPTFFLMSIITHRYEPHALSVGFHRDMLFLLQSPHLLKNSFLHGNPSPLKFALENKMLELEDFLHHAELFYPGRSVEFCKELVLTFQQVT